MFRRTLTLIAVALLAAGCGGADGPVGPSSITSIAISSPPAPLSAIGESVTLTATGRDDRGRTSISLAFSWASSNPSVAIVSGGTVTAVGNGTTTISAGVGSVTGSAQLTVAQRVSQMVVVFSRDTVFTLGDTARASAQARDARGNPAPSAAPVWTSSTPAVLVVDANGLLTAVADGSTTIRASADGVQAERTMQVRQRAARLVITRQPEGARAGLPIAIQPSAEVQDARGNRVTTDNTTVVTASIVSGGGVIAGGASATASAGVVNFTSLSAGGTVGSKVVELSAPSVASANTVSFELGAGLPAQVVVVSGNNQSAPAATVTPVGLTASVRDSYGNGVPSSPLAFTVSQGGGSAVAPPGVSDGNGNKTAVMTLSRYAGVATVHAVSSAAPQGTAVFTVIATPNGTIRGSVSAPTPPPAIMATSRDGSRRTAPAGSQLIGAKRRALSGFPATLPRVAASGAKTAPVQRAPSDAVGLANSGARATADDAVPGELLVTYRADRIGAPNVGARAFRQANVVAAVSSAIRGAVTSSTTRDVVSLLSVSPAILTARVRVEDGVDEAAAIAALRSDARVLAVERNVMMRSHLVERTALQTYLANAGVVRSRTPSGLDDFMSYRFTGASATNYPGGGNYPGNVFYPYQSWHYNMVSLPRAWELTQGSPSVLVAVVDDGIRFDHPAMNGVLTNDGYDFVPLGSVDLCGGGAVPTNGDGDGPDPDPTQPFNRPLLNGNCVGALKTDGNHGLHVAGTIGAARTSGYGLIGTNWQARIRPVRVLGTHGSGSNYTIAQGILYAAGLPADNGFGGTVTAPGGPARIINLSLGGTAFSTVMSTAVRQATDNGSLLIASAGNANSSVPNYPASYPEVMSISAVGPNMQRASYSSYGAFIDITAPGGDATPQATTSGVYSSTWNYVTNSPSWDGWNGTSMSAPHVSGIAALVLAREPGLSPAQLRARLTNYAIDLGIVGPDTFYGAGLLDARNAITASLAPPRRLLARVVSAATGQIIRTVLTTGVKGDFEFGALADGPYWVFAGDDDSNDGLTGVPMRAWGAFGGAAAPISVIVDGADIYPALFSIGRAAEIEPNDIPQQADELVVDGYMLGSIGFALDEDFYRLRIAQSGSYMIRVTGQVAACGFALESDPILSVYSGAGALIGTIDDVDLPNKDFCSTMTLNLSPGDYLVRVTGYTTGRYTVSTRRQ